MKTLHSSSQDFSWGAYAERLEKRPSWLDRAGSRIVGPFLRRVGVHSLRQGSFIQLVESHSVWASNLSDRAIRDEAAEIGGLLFEQGFIDPLVAKCFSLIREVSTRTLGKRHFDVQLLGGRVLLNGMIAEMETGEGKTLTATLPAATAALAGIPTHVITVNDYLADRDAKGMGPIYDRLGLKVGTIVHGLTPDARRAAYSADVTYCTNKEVAFDYLKDRIVLGRDSGRASLQAERLYEKRPRLERLLLRGLHFGIVDEADSVLVDEARTPLIISGSEDCETSERETCQSALTLSSSLIMGRDFILERQYSSAKLLPQGIEVLENASESLGSVWKRKHWREQLVMQALVAQHLYHDGKQYLIKDDKIQIIDEYTGRVMADRSWEHGLHQMIEVKEGCAITARNQPLAKISYQRFFRRYLRLAGMTGTASEVASELWFVYRLATVQIPTNRPRQRKLWPTQYHATEEEKWKAVVNRIAKINEQARPVLVGTRSVKASDFLSRLLTERNLPHQLLNARQDATEALIISKAGLPGRITVATNMAGRGTDITLGPDVAESGGLHVIATELHEARRIDRQLFGRSGRQGDPGSCEAIVSLEDELQQSYSRGIWKVISRAAAGNRRSITAPVRRFCMREAQRSAERLHRRMRRDLLEIDEQLDSTLAFSGRPE